MVEMALKHIHKKYDGNDFYSVTDFNLDVADREFIVFVGPSGCGKSTILKAVGGFIKPTSGFINLNGEAITKPGIDRAFVFQEFDQLLSWKTALENVVFAITSTRKI